MRILLALLVASLATIGCATLREKFKPKPKSDTGEITGPIVGGIIGGGVSNRLDQQARELAEISETKRMRNLVIARLKGDDLFVTGKTEVKPEAKALVQKLGDIVIKYPDNRIIVSGHSDQSGSDKANLRMSQQRAQVIMDLLVARGVPADNIKATGFGAGSPIADNQTAAGRARNRRMEIEITIPEEDDKN